MDDLAVAEPEGATGPRRVTFAGVLIALALAVFVVFWTWALFFASKESINRIGDREWAERAQAICIDAQLEREAMADFRRVEPDDVELLRERGELVDRTTDVLERMLDDVTAVTPTDDKGAAIVPDWEAEYRLYLGNRRDFADDLRQGSTEVFREADGGGVPISSRLSVFAVDNDMPDCAPPRDL